ncbi:MAG TPA: MFS transporter [Acidimicrobiales bacterium]|jgi:MFS family permease|nr:MFS transporter [Acidimicrobiales bacterium]
MVFTQHHDIQDRPTEALANAAPAPRRRLRLPTTVAFALLVSIVVSFLAGSSAPTPLYRVYQSEWGFSPMTITVVFGIYAVAVLVALLTAGTLSDHLGRRPVLVVALILQGAVMVIFATAGGVPALLVARVVQGLSTGAAVGAVGAGLLDLEKTRGTIANAVAPVTGTATGALLSGLLVQFLPAPTHLVYLVLLGIFVIQALGVALMSETSTPIPGALASLRPHVGVPPLVRRPLLVAIPALVAVWSLGGFYASLGPDLVQQVVGSSSPVLGGAALFVLAGFSALTVLVLRATPPRTVMFLGTVALITGVGITLVAVALTSGVVFFIGTAVGGVGFGAGFQGAMRTVLPLAAPHERSGVLSAIWVVSYLALGLPAIVAGFLVVHGGGFLSTTWEYGLAVMVLAALALAGLAWRGGHQPDQQSTTGDQLPAVSTMRKRPCPASILSTAVPADSSGTSSIHARTPLSGAKRSVCPVSSAVPDPCP